MSGRRRGWLLVLVAGTLGAVTAFGYLGGFLAPDEDAEAMPIALVNLDRGADVGTTSTRLGDRVVEELRAPDPARGDTVSWEVVSTRDDAVARLREDRAFAALVIPTDFSSRLAAIATDGSTDPATIEVLTNPASGSYSGAYSQAVATAAVDQVSRESARQLAGTLDDLGVTLSPATAVAVGRPVEATVTVSHPVGSRGGRGLAPFYFAVVVVVATLFATSTLNVALDVAAGRQELSVLGRPVRFGHLAAGLDPGGLVRAKLASAGPVAVTVGATVTAVALGPLNMTVDQPWLLAGFAVLGAGATAALTLALYTAFDLAGSVLAALFLVIYGVPASAGVYPVQALPGFFRFLHSWLPLRYLSDGARSLAFGGGPPGTVPRASAVLAAYTVVGVVLALVAARRTARHNAAGVGERLNGRRGPQTAALPRSAAISRSILAVMIAGAILTAAGPAAADEPGESEESAQLVRQGIALIVNTPGDMEGIEDKIVDAQEAPDQDGVDLELVAQAQEAFEREDMHEVRLLLERSIGARPHQGDQDPLPIGETRGAPGMEQATGAETGIDVVTDELAPDRDLSGNDLVGLVGLVAVAALGAWLALRFRPRPHRPEEARP